MPTDTLRINYTHPLEREYEGWIVWGIEKYLRQIGRRYAIHAVTPGLERRWPADERLSFDGKLVGLQMKQARLASLTKDQDEVEYDRMKWAFGKPQDQFGLVKNHPEIFYCLPTFINREYRREAIHHCLFWRPDDTETEVNAWYDNEENHTDTDNDQLLDCQRWGLFVENILRCDVGAPVSSKGEADRFLQKMADYLDERDVPFVEEEDPDLDNIPKPIGNWGGFYALLIEL